MSINTFSPMGLTSSAAVTGTVATLTPNDVRCTELRITNVGTQTVFILINHATTATVSNAMPIMANTSEVFAVGPTPSIQHIAAGVGSTIYVTPGTGS